MVKSLVREEFGPSLPALVARWARGGPRRRRLVRAASWLAVAALVVGAVFYPWHRGFSHGGAEPFSLSYPRSLHRVHTSGARLLELEQRRAGRLEQSLTVDRVTLPAYSGDVFGEFPVYASRYRAGLAARFGAFRLLGEGKTRVNGNPGYTLVWRGRLASGQDVIARDDLFVPGPSGSRSAIAIEMVATRAAHLAGPNVIGTVGPVGDTLQSLSLG